MSRIDDARRSPRRRESSGEHVTWAMEYLHSWPWYDTQSEIEAAAMDAMIAEKDSRAYPTSWDQVLATAREHMTAANPWWHRRFPDQDLTDEQIVTAWDRAQIVHPIHRALGDQGISPWVPTIADLRSWLEGRTPVEPGVTGTLRPLPLT